MLIIVFTVTSKVVIDVIDYFGQYQPTEMDWDLILHYMLSQKLSNDPSSQQPSQTTTIALPLPSSAGKIGSIMMYCIAQSFCGLNFCGFHGF